MLLDTYECTYYILAFAANTPVVYLHNPMSSTLNMQMFARIILEVHL